MYVTDPESLNSYLMQYVVPSLFGCLRGFGRVASESQLRLVTHLFPFGLSAPPSLPAPPSATTALAAQSVLSSPRRHHSDSHNQLEQPPAEKTAASAASAASEKLKAKMKGLRHGLPHLFYSIRSKKSHKGGHKERERSPVRELSAEAEASESSSAQVEQPAIVEEGVGGEHEDAAQTLRPLQPPSSVFLLSRFQRSIQRDLLRRLVAHNESSQSDAEHTLLTRSMFLEELDFEQMAGVLYPPPRRLYHFPCEHQGSTTYFFNYIGATFTRW